MKNKYCDEQTYDEDLSCEDTVYENPAGEALSEVDEDAFSYADEDHTDEDDIPEEPAGVGKGKRKKSAERLALETRFLALYEEFMRPTQEYSEIQIEYQADDLYGMLYQLNRGWAYQKAKNYRLAGFSAAEGEFALAAGCEFIPSLLMEDRAAGKYCDYPINHYSKIVQNKAIDKYFRDEFGRLPPKKKSPEDESKGQSPSEEETERRRKVPYTISLDAPISDDNSRLFGERLNEASVDPFENLQRPRWERDDKSTRLIMLYLQELMEYPNEPQKPLALMYGNILFQLYKDYGGEDNLSMMAKRSKKVSSPEWAHQRMGRATLLQLGIYSERVVQKCFSKSLVWGDFFNQHMLERTADGSRRVWGDLVYTKTYTEANTSNWIESIFKSTMIKCVRKLKNNPDLAEYAIEVLGAKNKFRKALEKIEKEDCR